MTEEQLNRAQVKAPDEPAARGFVAQVVPEQVDFGALLAVHDSLNPPSEVRRRYFVQAQRRALTRLRIGLDLQWTPAASRDDLHRR